MTEIKLLYLCHPYFIFRFSATITEDSIATFMALTRITYKQTFCEEVYVENGYAT